MSLLYGKGEKMWGVGGIVGAIDFSAFFCHPLPLSPPLAVVKRLRSRRQRRKFHIDFVCAELSQYAGKDVEGLRTGD